MFLTNWYEPIHNNALASWSGDISSSSGTNDQSSKPSWVQGFEVKQSNPGPNPTTGCYNATSSLVRFEKENIFLSLKTLYPTITLAL
jgi:hypothetical protein